MAKKGVDGGEGKIRVLIGEDSSFMRRLISDSLSSDPAIEVAGAASNGREVLKLLVDLRPDVITLDLEMPRMDGLETLRYIMSEWPTPVIILSAHTGNGARMALTCLEFGAVDFVPKTLKGSRFSVDDLISKVKAAAGVDPQKVRFAPTGCDLKVKVPSEERRGSDRVVLLGASTGGPQVLMEIIPSLPAGLDAGVVVVQHMPPNFTRYLAERLDARSQLSVREAEEKDPIRPGQVLVAPGGMHIFIEERMGRPEVMLLPRNELQKTACPSVDFAMTSFSSVFKDRLLGVVLTGMGKDGLAGSEVVRENGGRIICQDEETSMIYGMPGAIVSSGLADEIVPAERMARRIAEFAGNVVSEETINGSK